MKRKYTYTYFGLHLCNQKRSRAPLRKKNGFSSFHDLILGLFNQRHTIWAKFVTAVSRDHLDLIRSKIITRGKFATMALLQGKKIRYSIVATSLFFVFLETSLAINRTTLLYHFFWAFFQVLLDVLKTDHPAYSRSTTLCTLNNNLVSR